LDPKWKVLAMKCRVCGVEADHPQYEVPEMMYGTHELFPYFQCSECGCLQIVEVPSDMRRHYEGPYYSYRPVRRKNPIKRLAQGLRDRFAVSGNGFVGKLLHARSPAPLLDLLRPLRVTPDSAILDVGCGSAQLLYSLREIGFRNLLGADPFIEQDIEYDNGLSVRKLDINHVPGRCDLIMFHHSFEHVPDPLATLRAVFERLNAGGRCMLRVPTVSSFAWQHYGVHWVQLDAPRHFHLFSRRSIEALCEQTGFSLDAVVYDSGPFQFWGSEQYLKNVPLHDERSFARNPKASMFRPEEIADFTKRAHALNRAEQGDQAVFYLSKTS
jgi:SAM-dependent methyltransferase